MTRMVALATAAWVVIIFLFAPVVPRVSLQAPGLSSIQRDNIVANSRLIVVLSTSITFTIFVVMVTSRARFSRLFVVCASCALWISQAFVWCLFRDAF